MLEQKQRINDHKVMTKVDKMRKAGPIDAKLKEVRKVEQQMRKAIYSRIPLYQRLPQGSVAQKHFKNTYFAQKMGEVTASIIENSKLSY